MPFQSDIIVLRLFLPEIFALLGSLITFVIISAYPNELASIEIISHSEPSHQEDETTQHETELYIYLIFNF